MTESLVKAEKAQPANYAGMNYEGLCNYVKTQINLETKKQVGMQVMTHSYVMAMRELAKDEEIVYCFMNEMLMGQSPVMSKSKIIDVDDQAFITDEAKSIDAPSEKPTRLTEKKLVELAMKTVEELPLPEDISAKYSYYACYEFKRSNGELILEKSCGWNEPIEVLEKLKLVEPMRVEDHYKNAKTVVVGNYHVYILSGKKCRVSHFNMTDSVEPYVVDYSKMPIPEECKKVIEDAKWWADYVASLPENTNCESKENEEGADALWEEPASGDSGSIHEKDEVSEEQRLIEKAVEMAKSRGVGIQKLVSLSVQSDLSAEISALMNWTPLRKATGSVPRPTKLLMFPAPMIIPPTLLMKGKQFVCSTTTPKAWQQRLNRSLKNRRHLPRQLSQSVQKVTKFGDIKNWVLYNAENQH